VIEAVCHSFFFFSKKVLSRDEFSNKHSFFKKIGMFIGWFVGLLFRVFFCVTFQNVIIRYLILWIYMFFLKRNLLALVLLFSAVLSSAPRVGTRTDAQAFVVYINQLINVPTGDLDAAVRACEKALGFIDKMEEFIAGTSTRCRLSSSQLNLNCVFSLELTKDMHQSVSVAVENRENYLNSLLQEREHELLQAQMLQELADFAALHAVQEQGGHVFRLSPLRLRCDSRSPSRSE
jgi:hypothetical protein